MTNVTNAVEEANDGFRPESPMRARPDGATDPAGEAGWYLERERERRGESLEASGEECGIHPYHIEAIEHGDMTRMPERLEALEMIGHYAQYLGFDPEPLVRHYAQFLPFPKTPEPDAHPADPAPLSSAKIMRFARLPKFPRPSFRLSSLQGGPGGLVASIVCGALLFAGASWMMLPTAELPQVAEQVSDPMPTASTGPEEATVKISEEPLPEAVTTVAEPAVNEQEGTNLGGLAALIEENVSGASIPAEPKAVASAEDMTLSADGRAYGAKASGAGRLVLKAKAPVWVRIEDAQGNVVMTHMLMGGDTYEVPDRKGLVVIARDGGLLSYVIDGKDRGILGTPGEILVGRPLDIKALEGSG